MDFMEKITELRAQKSQLLTQAEGLVTDGKFDEADQITAKMEGINSQISSLEKLADASRERAGAYDGALHNNSGKTPEGKDEDKPFASLGEQLRAVYNFRKNHVEDKRLQKVNNAVLGSNEGSGTDGGFALQIDFAGMIMESAVQQSPLLNRLDRYTCSSAANAMRWVSADETDVSKSVFGGVQMYWASEGATVAASKPQFREMKMDLEKMMGFLYCTDEMLEDAAFMTSFAGPSFSMAGDRLLTEGVIAGDGVGKPLGLLHSKALIAVAKETSQEAATFVGANAIKMQARAMPRNRDRLVWLMHPDLEEQLPYDKLVKLSREADANIHLILACVSNHPELKRSAWYHDKMGCATPADAVKKLLRKGEADKIIRAIDLLHGYGVGSVVPATEEERQERAIAAVEELEKN